MTKKLSAEELAQRKADRLAKKHAVPQGHDMLREAALATLAANTEQTLAAARERNTVKTKVVTTEVGEKVVESHVRHSAETGGYNLNKLAEILNHTYGRNVSGRFGYALNFVAARFVRDLLKKEMAEAEKDPAERAAEKEINEYFGFDTPQQNEDGTNSPVITLTDAIHWQIVTWMYVMDISQYTESDERGMKSKPYAWMAKMVKNPITMLYSDARYGQKQQVSSQVINAAKLGLKDELLAEAQTKYDEETKKITEARVEDKLNFLKGFMRDKHAYRILGTEEQDAEITDFVIAAGIDVPRFIADLASDYKFKTIENALDGKYIGEVDEDFLSFVPEHKMSWIGKSHEERLAEAKAKFAKTHRLTDEKIAAHKATTTPEAQEELKRNIRRVTREDAAQQTAMCEAMSKAVRH